MLEGLSALAQSYWHFLNLWSIAYALGGSLIGILVGCLPGLSATLCIALLTTLTRKPCRKYFPGACRQSPFSSSSVNHLSASWGAICVAAASASMCAGRPSFIALHS